VLELSGEERPETLARELAAAETPEAQAAVGVAHATALARDLLAGGAPGIHLYTFNRSRAPLAVLRGAGLLDPSDSRIPA
jgi:methylenetetrahydrofolate reductase (NADPH)